MDYEIIECRTHELRLDEDNPRLSRVESQSEALQALIDLNDKHFRNLMVSIKENGLDPGDSLYIIEDPNDPDEDYIAVDGNRRLAALMVLTNPSLLDGIELPPKVKERLQVAAVGFDKTQIGKLRCVLFESRSDANEWIERRHVGSADGEGRINWGFFEIKRFSGDRLVVDALEFVGKNVEYTEAEWENTRDLIESRKGSVIDRVLDSAAGKSMLGLDIRREGDTKIPTTTRKPEFVLKLLKRIIEDAAEGSINTRNLNSASDIEGYLDRLPEEFQPDTSDKSAPIPLKDLHIKPKKKEKAEPTSNGGSKKKRIPRLRATLAPRQVEFQIPNSERGKMLLAEASKIKIDDFRLASAFVLRAFIELAVTEYARAHHISKTKTDAQGKNREVSLTDLARSVRVHIEDQGTVEARELRPFTNLILTKTSSTSIQSLNSFVHNKFATPTPDDLRSGWDSCVPILIAVYGAA